MRRPAWKLLAATLLVASGVGLLSALGVDVTQLSPQRIRAAILAHGPWAPLVYLVVFAQPVVPLPGSAMLALAGVVFGRGWGSVAGLTGLTLRACGAFAVARLLGRDTVAWLLRGHMARLDQRLGKHAFKAMLIIRLVPNVPLDMQNYALSFSRVRFGPYVLATVVGFIPGSIAYAYLGDSLIDPAQSWKLIVAVCLILALLLAQWGWKKRSRRVASGEAV